MQLTAAFFEPVKCNELLHTPVAWNNTRNTAETWGKRKGKEGWKISLVCHKKEGKVWRARRRLATCDARTGR